MFGDLGSGELTPLSGNMYSCRVPNIPSFTGEGGGVCSGNILPAMWSSCKLKLTLHNIMMISLTSACMHMAIYF